MAFAAGRAHQHQQATRAVQTLGVTLGSLALLNALDGRLMGQ